MINRRRFVKSLAKTEKTLAKRLVSYMKEQNEPNVHHLRTAARRRIATVKLLPSDIRNNARTRKYAEACDRLIRRNAKVRDLDIVLSRVIPRGSDSGYSRLAENIQNTRQSAIKPALTFARSFTKGKRLGVRGKDLENPAIRRRFNKVTRRLESRVEKRLPIVLSDATNKRELHRLREDSRMLRYTLETAGVSNTSHTLVTLRSWQDTLGLIHDSDIVIDYLQNKDESPESRDLLRDELTERNRNYERFASVASRRWR